MSRPELYEFQLDQYTLPSMMIKIIKTMKKQEVAELIVSGDRIEKLRNNFPNKYFDQGKVFKSGDKVSIVMGLAGHKNS